MPTVYHRMSARSIVISGLKKINSLVTDAVHQAVFLRDTARPTTRQKISQSLGFAQALEWIAHHCLDQIQHPESGAPIGFYPKSQILWKLRMEYGGSLRFSLHQASRAAIPQLLTAFVYRAPRVAAR